MFYKGICRHFVVTTFTIPSSIFSRAVSITFHKTAGPKVTSGPALPGRSDWYLIWLSAALASGVSGHKLNLQLGTGFPKQQDGFFTWTSPFNQFSSVMNMLAGRERGAARLANTAFGHTPFFCLVNQQQTSSKMQAGDSYS